MGRGGGMGNPVNVGIAVQADWENREFISNISLNVRRLFDFLLRFGQLLFHSISPRPALSRSGSPTFGSGPPPSCFIPYHAELNCPCYPHITLPCPSLCLVIVGWQTIAQTTHETGCFN
ncbi:brick1 [Zea mays]|uniref:Brick1 n=1 Tax=Zea mays TaxID=4577 RepID=A0A1D6HQ76_MAIZE|nr:brick1 [Zea mays]